MRYFEDFHEKEVIDLGACTVSAEQIVEFASVYDPAPFHLSEDGGRDSMLGGLAASGWHTCCIAMRMICDRLLLDSSSQGSPGVERIAWHIPVMAGATLTGRATVLGKRPLASRKGMGMVRFRFEYFVDGDRLAMTLDDKRIMFLRRTEGESVS